MCCVATALSLYTLLIINIIADKSTKYNNYDYDSETITHGAFQGTEEGEEGDLYISRFASLALLDACFDTIISITFTSKPFPRSVASQR